VGLAPPLNQFKIFKLLDFGPLIIAERFDKRLYNILLLKQISLRHFNFLNLPLIANKLGRARDTPFND